MKCPNCGINADKVLYCGIPMKLSMNYNCRTLFGFWSFMVHLAPFNGMFITYTGSYLDALWYFLTTKE
jgi:hypothetical protein